MKFFFKKYHENDYYLIISFILINILIRLIILNFIPDDTNYNFKNDQSKYWRLSDYLISGRFFDYGWDITRLPIYPVFLAFLRELNDSVQFILIIQNILFIIGLTFFFKIYKEIFNDKNSIYLAFFLTCINLNLIFVSNVILTESVFIIFSTLFIYFFIKYLKSDNNIKYLLISAIILALCYYTRPIAYYYVFVGILIFIKEQKFKYSFRDFSIFFVIFLVFTSLWSLKNLKYHKNFSFNSTSGIFVGYYLPYLDQYKFGLNLNEAKEFRYKKYNEYLKQKKLLNLKNVPYALDKIEREYFYSELKEFQLSHFFKLFIVGTLKNLLSPTIIEFSYFYDIKKTNFSSIQSKDIFQKFKIYIFKNENKIFSNLLILSLLIYVIKYLISICGLKIINKKNLRIFVFFGLFIAINLILTVPFGGARYRLPFEIILIIFLTSGIINILKYFKLLND